MFDLTDHRLDNGLRVVVCEDHTIPAVAVDIWYGVGSRHEQPGRTGLAHLLEHLMFEGSRNVAPGEHTTLVRQHGGQVNATTGFDHTKYFCQLPSGGLRLAFWLEADRMATLAEALTPERKQRQCAVIGAEKHERDDNVPYGSALERLVALAFGPDHPCGHTPMGSPADLSAASVADVAAFHGAHYAPDNAVLAVVGDVSADEVLDAAGSYFGAVPTGRASAAPGLTDEPLPGPVRADVCGGVPADQVQLLFRLPGEDAAAELAMTVLGAGASGRLARRLTAAGGAPAQAGAKVIPMTDTVAAGLVVGLGGPAETIEERLVDELAAFAAEGPSLAELETAQAQTERAWLSCVSTCLGRADEIARHGLRGDVGMVNERVAQINAVTAEQVRAVAERFLHPEHRATVAFRSATRAQEEQ